MEGFIPALVLTLWVGLVPAILRCKRNPMAVRCCIHRLIFSIVCYVQAGALSLPMVELFTQRTYLVFLVLQVFLITTFTSTLPAILPHLLGDIQAIQKVLATELPRASTFFSSFILVQSLADCGSNLLPISDLWTHHFSGTAGRTPRIQYRLWKRLRRVHWGTVFPRVTNMAIIGTL